LEVADRVVVMNHGRIEQVGTPSEVFRRPASEFVMTFLGEANLFRGRVAAGQVHLGGVALPAPPDAPEHDKHVAKIFIRPHDLELAHEPAVGSLEAEVVRIQTTGARARLELRSSALDGPILAEVGDDELAELALAPGDRIYIRPRRLQVFRGTIPPPIDETAG